MAGTHTTQAAGEQLDLALPPYSGAASAAPAVRAVTLPKKPVLTASRAGFTALDEQFADFLVKRATNPDPLLWLAGALVSQAREQGRSHLELTQPPQFWAQPGADGADGAEQRPWPQLAQWQEALRGSGVVAEGLADEAAAEDGSAYPLTLAPGGTVLYLTRYWEAERYIAQEIRRRAGTPTRLSSASLEELGAVINAVFAQGEGTPQPGLDWQKAAVLLAIRRGFLVVSGGPGTGKTTVVTKLLAALARLNAGQEMRYALAAPTGKAAARLQESLHAQPDERTPDPASANDVLARPINAVTLHRLLGAQGGGRGYYYGAQRQLTDQLVVLDECSMVDLLLLEQLLRALPRRSGLLLLGDKDQLAPVEVGGVLGELRTLNAEGTLDAVGQAEYAQAFGTPEGSPAPAGGGESTLLLQLQRNYRFGEGNAIMALSQAIRRADVETAMRVLAEAETGQTTGLTAHRYTAEHLPLAALERQAREWFGAWRDLTDPTEALAALLTHRILAPIRGGPMGVIALNELVRRVLHPAANAPAWQRPGSGSDATFYPGRPVMILRNDHNLRLNNGETGIILPQEVEGAPRLRAWFQSERRRPSGVGAKASTETPRSMAPVRLPLHETAYAMTVHKSQGSEFTSVALVLPPHASEVLSRELVYTAVTRARRTVEVWYEPETLRWALQRHAPRTCRVGDLLRPGA